MGLVAVAGRVKISELKAHLSEYLRKVQRGFSITVLDRDTPVAMLSPPSGSPPKTSPAVREGSGRLASIRVQPALPVRTDSLALLVEDRSRR
jgi:prevent-host-death family protein